MDAPERSGGSDSSQKRGDVHFWNLRRLPDARKTDCRPARRGDGRCDPGNGITSGHDRAAGKIVRHLAERKGLVLGEDGVDYGLFKEQQYDKLAATLREYLDLDAVYKMMREYE